MPQTLTLDDLAAYGAAPSPAAAAPPAKTLTLSQLADYGAPVDLRPRNVGPSQPQSAWKQFISGATEEQPDDSSHGFLRSFYDASVRPIVGMVHDSYVRGDLGEHAVSEMLDSFKDQLGTFAAHPDIRNLPVIGTGATATAARAQKQFDEGNYTGAAGTMLGFLGQFAAPELIKTPLGAADLPESVTKPASAAAAKVRAALPDSVPTFPAWATDAAGVVAPPLAFKMRVANRVANVANKLLGPSEADAAAAGSAPLTGADLARQKAILEGRALDRAAVVERMRQSLAAPETPATAPESWEPGMPGTPAPPAQWEPYRAPAAAAEPHALTLDQLAEYGAPAQASTAAEGEIDAAPEARLTLSPELAARAEELRQETHASYHAPDAKPQALTPANKIQDAADAWKAYQAMQAQDVEMGNRAAQADRIAAHIIKNGQEPTDANIAAADKATANLPETTPTGKVSRRAYTAPSDETADMIRDRVDWHNARQSAEPAQAAVSAAAPGAISVTEQQLRDSLAARGVPVNLESGRPAETAAETVRGTGTGAASEAGRLFESGTGNGAPLPEASSGGESGQPAAAGERKTVRVPGEAKQYGARYEVRELQDLQPSHNGQTFQKNPEYEHSNDRDYNNPDNQRKIVDASVGGDTGFDPRYVINTAPDASIGPPVADSRGNVLGGNGRTMTLQRVFESNPAGAAEYRALLDRNAHHFGIDPADYAHMKQPVLVRVLDAAETGDAAAVQRAVTDFNKVGTAALTPAERAIADAHGVSQKTLDDIGRRIEHAGSDATLNSMLDEGRNGVEILQNLINDGVISPQERATLASADELKPMGRARVSNLMLGRFFTNAQQLDNLPNAIRAKMERMAAPLARAEGSPEYSLSPTVREALDLIDAADMHGVANLRDFVNQKELYSDTRQFSPASLRIAEQLRTRDPVALTNAMRQYAARAKEAADYQGPGVFGDIPEPLTRGEAFDESFGSAALERDRVAKEADKAKKAAAKAAKKAAEVATE